MELDTDLVIVGGGPAGCAAAVMAASLGLRSVLIESHSLCHKVAAIASIVNVIGYATGREIASRAVEDLAKAPNCELMLGLRVTQLHADDECVTVTIDEARTLRAAFGVVATGVRPQLPDDTDWIHQDRQTSFKAVWEATAVDLTGTEAIVLGVDRPLGTVLRTHAGVDTSLVVLYSMADAYKADEVQDDPRVTLVPTSHVDVIHDRNGDVHLRAVSEDGERTFGGHHVYLNLGSRPVVLGGDLVADRSGYCPPERQHARILVAGDVRGARYQRIMTAFGTGADAALKAYYTLNQVA